MSTTKSHHTFHIPVLGLSYTVDSPIKVAHLGISSVMSMFEHNMVEKMRKYYAEKFNLPFEPITTKMEDFRAQRITSYLNLVDEIVKKKFENLKSSINEGREEIEKYFELLPSFSDLKTRFDEMLANNTNIADIQKWVSENLHIGSIDINLMTKLDGPNYEGSKQLPIEHNNMHAALRGYAKSNLESSIVLSAGMNPRLFGYMENFEDFYPDAEGNLKKKIIIKVSDYRSALIQGKFFAKKGLWVSEFRVESGLNCGGHAFASDGYLLGPILEEFKANRETLVETIYKMFTNALERKGKNIPDTIPEVKLTAQGGVGTTDEHNFLINYFDVDSIGWGTPFLLVPEATTVDDHTLKVLSDAKEEDLYLSHASPLGVPFNNVRGSSGDIERKKLATAGKPGSACPKRFLALDTTYSEKPLCAASKKFINIKLEELKSENLSDTEYNKKYDNITEKECLCNGLTAASLLVYNLDTKMEGSAVTICPGPNMAYYSGTFSLKEMADHIYGRINILNTDNRPNMFIKELKMYIDYLKSKMDEVTLPFTDKQIKYFTTFQTNLDNGIEYYKKMFSENKDSLKGAYERVIFDLENLEMELKAFPLNRA